MAMSYNSVITIDRDRRALLSTAAIGIADAGSVRGSCHRNDQNNPGLKSKP